MTTFRARLYFSLFFFVSLLFCSFASASDPAPAPAKPAPDVLIFTNGDQLTGKLMHSTDDTVAFHSDMAGDINVSWSKVKELRSQRQFVVLGKGTEWNRRTLQKVPAGSIQVRDNKIQLNGPQEVQVMPIKSTARVIQAG